MLSPLPKPTEKKMNARKRSSSMEPQKKRTKFALSRLNDKETTVCILCGEDFEEDWIQCKDCGGWVHEECASANETDPFYHSDH
ncbi:hypothetical protein PR048_012399, partial [Dryococelus australis]